MYQAHREAAGRGATKAILRRRAVLAVSVLSAACASSGSDGYEGPVGRRAQTVGLAGTGTTTSLIETEIDASTRRTIAPASLSDVWSIMPTVFEALDIEVETFDATVLAIGNTNFSPRRIDGRRMSYYLDCGNNLGRPNADRYRVSVYLMVMLEAAEAGTTEVITVMDAFARPLDVAGGSVHCRSEGRLERKVEELIAERL